MRAAIYTRISQDRDGTLLGVQRQQDDCEALARDRGWEVGPVFVDDDVSAFKGRRRDGYEQLLEAIADGTVGAVVAWHPDRLHRSPVELERFIDVVQASGCEVATVRAGDLDLGTAAGRMTARVVGAVARHESEQKSERLRRQRAQAALAGRAHGGRRAFGYKSGNAELEPAEAALLREAADRVLAGETHFKVAKDWNERGVASTTGRRWQATRLRLVLISPRIAGLRVHKGDIVGEGQWPAIVTRAEHERLVALLRAPERRGALPRSLLSGLLVCGHCGHRMTFSSQKRGDRYNCHRQPGRWDRCGRISIVARYAEEAVVAAVLEATATLRIESDPAVDDTVLADLEARLTEAAEMFAAGEIGRAEWLTARTGIEDRISRARRDMLASEHRARIVDHGTIAHRWDTLTLDERRRVLGLFVGSVTVAPSDRSSPADRLTIEWLT